MMFLMGTDDVPYEYCVSSWVLHVHLKGTDDLPHGHCVPSWVVHILMGTAGMSHRY